MLIRLHNVSLSFSDTVILDQSSIQIHRGQKVGISAPNGTGKTTLLNCIAGRQEINSGNIRIAPGSTIAYFEQQGINLGSKTIREELEESYNTYFSIQEEITKQEQYLAANEKDLKKMQITLDRLEHLHDALHAINFDNREADMFRTLKGLGFQHDDIDKAGETFSGGWQMKVGLAKVLLSQPDILLLDEPTNHLDIDARMWLITVIQKLQCTLLLISHDRYFLDNTIDSIIELSQGILSTYTGNYSNYELQLKNNKEAQEQYKKQYEDEIKKQSVFINRFRYKASKAKQVQSRIKAIEKITPPITSSSTASITLNFPLSRKSSEHVLEAINIRKHYDDEVVVLDNLNLSITRGEKVALLGPNGIGKSTLMRIIATQDQDYGGSLEWGSFVHYSYFSQRAADLLHEDNTVWDYIMGIESSCNDIERRRLLGAFLFSNDTIHKKIAVLSGGEKSRVLLCSLTLKPCNFLILDEPYNHLDLETQTLLLNALKHFEGTVLFTTHDRFLLEHLADKIIEMSNISTNNDNASKAARITTYLGNYEYYLWKKEKEKTERDTTHDNDSIQKTTPNTQNAYHLQKKAQARIRKLEKEEAVLVDAIDALEQRVHERKEQFAHKEIYNNPQRISSLKDEIAQLTQQLAQLHTQWDEIHARLSQS